MRSHAFTEHSITCRSEPGPRATLNAHVQLEAPDGIAAGPDGTLYVAQKNTIVKIFVGTPQVTNSEYLVPSVDGRTLYRFDARGKHLETFDAMTSVRQYKFEYDKNQGLLATITDRDGNVTRIERNGSGVAAADAMGSRLSTSTTPTETARGRHLLGR